MVLLCYILFYSITHVMHLNVGMMSNAWKTNIFIIIFYVSRFMNLFWCSYLDIKIALSATLCFLRKQLFSHVSINGKEHLACHRLSVDMSEIVLYWNILISCLNSVPRFNVKYFLYWDYWCLMLLITWTCTKSFVAINVIN